jgi:CheY-like chemotaxis protein
MEKAMQTANRANQSKSEFLAIMSHEIRTPMNSVLGFAELLSDTELEEEQKDFVDLINRNAKSLLNIINDILDFSRIESGRLELEESPMSVEAVALEAIELMRPQSKDKGIEILLEKSLEEPGNYHLGDSLRLRQILLNLLSNAVKFTPEGKVTLHLDASASEEAGKTRFDFAVEDTGVGIPPDRLDSLFQPFGQAERSTSRRFGGSGLGLLISQRLCQFMGGKISVVSEQDEGSTFSFSLDLKIADFQDEEQGSEVAGQPSNEQRESNAIPAKEEEEEATAFEPPRSSDIPVEDTSSPDLSGPRLPILLAEDNPANQMVIRRMLGRLGLNADLASNGSEAVDLWRVHRHPLIFMDLQMPILDGFETVQRIRGLERSESGILKLSGKSGANRTVIVAITANALRGDRQKCLAAGMDDYISKPVKLETFREVISKHFPRILA